jgi:fumarate reductase flavoprotein subunit
MVGVAPSPACFDETSQVVVIGAGACGLVAALRAASAGAEVAVLERDGSPTGSTSLSSGFIPAAGTRFQRAIGVVDSPALLVADLQGKSKGRSEPALAALAAENAGPALEWLADAHGLEWIVLDDFLYPGHSRHRMHAVPDKTGAALEARLLAAAEASGISIVTDARVETLFTEAGSIAGVGIARPDGREERLGCGALILACNGYGGAPEMVARHIPEMAGAPYFGHVGNTGDALTWGVALGAEARCLSACQGHGSVAHPHGVLITWGLMMEGGVQVNTLGQRFQNEHRGYSEAAVDVLAQPGGVAWCVYDARLHDFAVGFPDYRDAVAAGAVLEGATAETLADAAGLPVNALAETLEAVSRFQKGEKDPLGRDFTGKPPLQPPYRAIKVTGALFHTQGGLMIDRSARVLRPDRTALPNLFAGGGAACGVSGPEISGYLSGAGLLTAVAFGYVAGEAAARLVR